MPQVHPTLSNSGDEVVLILFDRANDYLFDIDHVDVSYTFGAAGRVDAVITARALSKTGDVGKYRGSSPVNYTRAALGTLLGSTPTNAVSLHFQTKYPFKIQDLISYLKTNYNVVLEASDILNLDGVSPVSETTVINDPGVANGMLGFRIAPTSKRFLPYVAGSGNSSTLFIQVVDPAGGQIQLIAGYTDLGTTANTSN